jgi:hypothetical protein
MRLAVHVVRMGLKRSGYINKHKKKGFHIIIIIIIIIIGRSLTWIIIWDC